MRIPGGKTLQRHGWYWRGRLLGGGVILGYHRVAEDRDDPHVLCVHPSHFRDHLQVISRHFQVVRPADLLGRSDAAPEPPSNGLELGKARRALALTFDDGYADVMGAALPLVEDVAMPLTVFVVAGAVGTDRFRWDRDRDGFDGRPLTTAELRELADHPLVEIGAHTLSHPDLTTLAPREVRREVVEGRDRLEALLNRPVTSFSYPHGGVNERVQRAVRESGCRLACASRPGLITESSDPLRLPRLWPPDVPGPAFERWLASWTGIRPGGARGGGASSMATATPTERAGP